MAKTTSSKKINFMIRYEIIDTLNKLAPAGQRSKFVNDLLEEGISRFQHRMALDEIDKMRAKSKVYATTEEILKLRDYGRK